MFFFFSYFADKRCGFICFTCSFFAIRLSIRILPSRRTKKKEEREESNTSNGKEIRMDLFFCQFYFHWVDFISPIPLCTIPKIITYQRPHIKHQRIWNQAKIDDTMAMVEALRNNKLTFILHQWWHSERLSRNEENWFEIDWFATMTPYH